MNGHGAVLAAVALTVACAALAALEAVRMRCGRSAWWDVLALSFAFYSGLLAFAGWGWLAVGAVTG